MSEDQQKQPKSMNSEPQTPSTPNEVSQTSIRKREQPFVKAQSIKVLRGTIDLLERIVEQLETEPVSQLPPTAAPPTSRLTSAPVLDTTKPTAEPDSISSVVEPVTTEPIADSPTEVLNPATEPVVSAPGLDIPTEVPKPVVQKPTVKQPPQPTQPKLTDRILPSFSRVQAFWDGILAKVRSLLPATWNEKLSDWGLTGAIATIVVVLLITTAALLPKTPAQVAKAPPNTIDAPPELKAPELPQPVEVEPPPPPELTPEQSLIAGIQNQVTEVTQQYGNGLIESIEANFQGSRLVVKVSNGWYDLKESQQNKLADDILSRSNELDFSKLEITDLNGAVLARSPVVGSNMVILKRQALVTNL